MLRVGLLALALTGVARLAAAPTNSVDWFTIDGGGGTSQGGAFSVRGTIGQPDGGTMQGGSLTVHGGFWGQATVRQTPGAPQLAIRLLGNGWAILSWPRTAIGFSLQETAVAGEGTWSPTPQPVVDSAMEHTVTVPVAGNFKCYRLWHP